MPSAASAIPAACSGGRRPGCAVMSSASLSSPASTLRGMPEGPAGAGGEERTLEDQAGELGEILAAEAQLADQARERYLDRQAGQSEQTVLDVEVARAHGTGVADLEIDGEVGHAVERAAG